ncbi:hypothetical protein BpHYR1_036727 [Brachionus plicatilis]|uniref:Uncharacterized protein n=1 Tax=Brachionus plicatilis TaxID=10195 RepID=A0A3M7RL56_BRAPC|nr:hypothetical protein BpHYR1_036727 [Brachionus plicatilis]
MSVVKFGRGKCIYSADLTSGFLLIDKYKVNLRKITRNQLVKSALYGYLLSYCIVDEIGFSWIKERLCRID